MQIISVLSKIVDSLTIYRHVAAQSAKHQFITAFNFFKSRIASLNPSEIAG